MGAVRELALDPDPELELELELEALASVESVRMASCCAQWSAEASCASVSTWTSGPVTLRETADWTWSARPAMQAGTGECGGASCLVDSLGLLSGDVARGVDAAGDAREAEPAVSGELELVDEGGKANAVDILGMAGVREEEACPAAECSNWCMVVMAGLESESESWRLVGEKLPTGGQGGV